MNKTFTVNDAKGRLLPGIKNAFLAHSIIDPSDPPPTIRLPNGTVYQAVYDNFLISAAPLPAVIKVIISFQQHDDGNFAIIRPLNPSTSKA